MVVACNGWPNQWIQLKWICWDSTPRTDSSDRFRKHWWSKTTRGWAFSKYNLHASHYTAKLSAMRNSTHELPIPAKYQVGATNASVRRVSFEPRTYECSSVLPCHHLSPRSCRSEWSDERLSAALNRISSSGPLTLNLATAFYTLQVQNKCWMELQLLRICIVCADHIPYTISLNALILENYQGSLLARQWQNKTRVTKRFIFVKHLWSFRMNSTISRAISWD